MLLRAKLFWTVLAAASAIIAYQLFVPPIIGLADQGDFRRTIGVFGYGPAHKGSLNVAWVERKYVPTPDFRLRSWDQLTSEYLFVGASVILNKLISRDGSLDITVIGFVHACALLVIFARFLWATRNLRGRTFVWLGALLIFTDVGYTAYWNSFYMEPASGLFAFLLLTESIDMCQRASVSRATLARWSLWALLLVLAKPQNAPLGLLLALFSGFVLRIQAASREARRDAWIGGSILAAVSVIAFLSTPRELVYANTYGMVFMGILQESHNPAADLKALGLDPQLAEYSGSGPWSPKTMYPPLRENGAIPGTVTLSTVDWFYLRRPARLWRHMKSMFPVATSLRPEWSGNFEPSAGRPAAARSHAFAIWSDFHQRALVHVIKFLLFALALPALLAIFSRFRAPRFRVVNRSLALDFCGLLALCCLAAFLTAIFGDIWDNVRHLFLFNLLLDACLLAGASAALQRWLSRRDRRTDIHAAIETTVPISRHDAGGTAT